jgi:hypothetical protein
MPILNQPVPLYHTPPTTTIPSTNKQTTYLPTVQAHPIPSEHPVNIQGSRDRVVYYVRV